MNLLAIDTSTETASVALLAQHSIISTEARGQKTHAQFILPMVAKLMAEAAITMNQLDAIVFGCGPGSFTGLRIACSIAKGFAYAHDLGLIPVSSLSTITWTAREQLNDVTTPVLAVLDARMQELYWAYYAKEQYASTEYVSSAVHIQIPQYSSIVLAGVGISTYWTGLSTHLGSRIIHRLDISPQADAMIRLAQFMKMKAISVAEAQPIYVRNQVI